MKAIEKKEMATMGTKQEQANLILRLYEMRRDEVFRKARTWFDTEFNPKRDGKERAREPKRKYENRKQQTNH